MELTHKPYNELVRLADTYWEMKAHRAMGHAEDAEMLKDQILEESRDIFGECAEDVYLFFEILEDRR